MSLHKRGEMDTLQHRFDQVTLTGKASPSKQKLPTGQKLEYRKIVTKRSGSDGMPDERICAQKHEQSNSLGTPPKPSEIAVNAIKCNAVSEPNYLVGNGENESTDSSAVERMREERRERQKVKKQIKKEEKRLQREEEIRKKKLAPKDQKITIIDQSTMERLLSKDNINSNTKTISHFDSEFPPMFPPLQKEKYVRPYKMRGGRGDHNNVKVNQKKSPVLAVQEQTSDLNEKGVHMVPSAAANDSEALEGKEVTVTVEGADKPINITEEKPKGKRPKRSQPICVQIEDILKLSTKPSEPAQKHPETKTNSKNQPYCGNILDSDKPERKRGKQREAPKKKKVSTLRSIVLQGREKRKLEREAMRSALETGNTEEISDRPNSIQNECLETAPADAVHNGRKVEELESIGTHPCMNNVQENVEEKEDDKNRNVKNKNGVNIWNIGEMKKVDENQNVSKNGNAVKEPLEENRELHENKMGEYAECSSEDSKINRALSVNATEVQNILKPKIHNRRFREYCDHLMTKELHEATIALLADIVKFQDRQFLRSPLKAIAHRRHVTGLKQVHKFLLLNRCRLVVIAPDLERNDLPGGLDDKVNEIKAVAKEKNIPYVFAVPRRLLGRVLRKKVAVSAMAVLSFDGSETNFHTVISTLQVAREQYQFLADHVNISSEPVVNERAEEQQPSADVNQVVIASLLAKLTEQQKGWKSPFLEVIEQRCYEAVDSETNEDEG